MRDLIAATLSGVMTCMLVVEIIAPRLPTRTECIIGYNLDWSAVKADHHTIRNSFELNPGGHRFDRAMAATSISVPADRIYFQLSSRCDKKEEHAQALIQRWKSDGLDIPKFTRIPDPIIPSVDTIDVSGPAWRDRD